MTKKSKRQKELRRMYPERYRSYDKTPARKFSKMADAAKRKIIALKMVAEDRGTTPFRCAICGDGNLIHLTIDHEDESGSEKNLYYKIIKGISSTSDKQVLCFSCNAALRVLGHGNLQKVEAYVKLQNEARARAIMNGQIKTSELPVISIEEMISLAGFANEGSD